MTDMLEPITVRMLGENLTLVRSQWLELLESLKPESPLAIRLEQVLRLSPGDRRLLGVVQGQRPSQRKGEPT